MAQEQAVAAVPLRHNRAFLTLQAGRWTSTLGTQISTFAYPLLVLSTTGSPLGTGAVVAVRLLPFACLGPVAGAVADRVDRRRIMLVAESGRATVLAGLALLVVTHQVQNWHILLAAFLEGCGAVFFTAAQAGLVRAVVPRPQLRAAASVDAARTSAVRLVGPPLGGVLFALGRAVPFVVDAVSYLVSLLTLASLRTTGTRKEAREVGSVVGAIRHGWSFMRRTKVLMTCALVLSLSSFAIPGGQLLLLLAGHQRGWSAQTLGVVVAAIGGAALVGAGVASLITARASLRTVILLELWACVTGVPFLLWPSPWVLLPSLMLQAALAPVTDSAVMAYVIGAVPDELLGRVTSTMMTMAAVVAPLGPIVAGALTGIGSTRLCMAFFIAVGVAFAMWVTTLRNLRDAHWDAPESQPASVPPATGATGHGPPADDRAARSEYP